MTINVCGIVVVLMMTDVILCVALCAGELWAITPNSNIRKPRNSYQFTTSLSDQQSEDHHAK
jgi:hypothetical protein